METDEQPQRHAAPGTYAFADVEVDARAHRLSRGGGELAVEPKAFAVLLEFLAHPGQLLTRDQLLDAVWGHGYVTPATLNRIIAQLRKALADDSEHPHCIQTVHGLGYRFIARLATPPSAPSSTLRFAPPAHARLPECLDPLIGRGREIAELQALLETARLVTVIGSGGIGKTRAALEVARSRKPGFPDGVWVFDFTTQVGMEGVIGVLAGAFGIRDIAGSADIVDSLCELLRMRCALLVFDNCERVAGPLGQLTATLLTRCARLHVLATSQQRLNCTGEALYRLPALEVPAAGEWTSAGDIARLMVVPAVKLLLERSRRLASEFMLTPANASIVAELCRRLDGVPLALELAAARLRVLSPEQLLRRLDDRFHWLAEANSGRPARQQTLSALIEWSFALLSEREQALLCSLGVFGGGWTLAGANAVGMVFGLDDEQTLDLLTGLVDKSLVVTDPAVDPPRYRLLDSVRLFALARLAESGDEARVRRAHLTHFVDVTARVNDEIRGKHQQLWVERMSHEQINLQAAFDYAMAHAELAGSALAIVANLAWYFRIQSAYPQAGRWLDAALGAAHSNTPQRARAMIVDGLMCHLCQIHERAIPLLREGIAAAADLDDEVLAATGKAWLAFELATTGDFAESERCVQAALAVAGASDDRWLGSLALLSRAIVHAMRAEHREAEKWLGQAAELVLPPDGDAFQWGYVLINRALQRFHLHDARGAAQDWLCNLDLCIEQQNRRGLAGCVEGAAYLALTCSDAEGAGRFLGAAARVRKLTGAPLLPQWSAAHAATERAACNALGDSFAQALAAGAAERFEDVVDEARKLLTELAAGQSRTVASSPSGS